MLVEAFLSATAQTSPALRRLGLVADAVALWSRATRCRRAWAPHEALSRALVERAMADLPRRRTAVVLGSGLLRDVPLDALLRAFARVVLVDAVHLWPARLRARHPRIERRVGDLTGLAVRLTQREGAGPVPASPTLLAEFAADPAIDLVISACVLSQLPFAPGRWLERHPALSSAAPEMSPTRILQRHLADLAALPARVCLITDVGFTVQRRDGTAERRVDLLPGIALPRPDETWEWELAPPGEIARGVSYRHRVHGYADLRRPA